MSRVSAPIVLSLAVAAGLAGLSLLSACVAGDDCADSACRAVAGIEGEGVDAIPNRSPTGCASLCSHLTDTCGWGFAAADGIGGTDADNCAVACSQGAFTDDERVCLAQVPCSSALALCLDGTRNEGNPGTAEERGTTN